MLTIFTCPKPFTDPHIRMIQRNAIQSWMHLEPRPEILLMGDDEGVGSVAREFGLRHIPELKCNRHGTPLISDIFQRGAKEASSDIVAYANSDIIFGQDLMSAVSACSRPGPILLAGTRWNYDLTDAVTLTIQHGGVSLLIVRA